MVHPGKRFGNEGDGNPTVLSLPSDDRLIGFCEDLRRGVFVGKFVVSKV